ncbi:molybdopterin molybdotransferase MoeA [Glycomyces sp. NPDC047010]|uniref:molybdopterin molybdotransferase MoeA n=1 Tax=Glycomyces sp. NPDC047010 TaxID=3155023 RepID=UPI0033D46653
MVDALTTAEPATRRDMPWPAAREAAHAAAEPLGPVAVPLRGAAGSVLAADLVAPTPLPGFDTAAMDGYALNGPGPWRLAGEAVPGSPWPGSTLVPGAAIRIATGAVVPAGAHAVLPVEHGVLDGDSLTGPELPAGKHIRYRGEDAPAGARLVAAGTRIGPSLLGLAAACGYDALQVAQAPTVRLVVTGDELVHAGIAPAGRVRDALGPLLESFLPRHGALVTESVHAPDHPGSALADAVTAPGPHVVVVAGSTSVGTTDGLRPLLRTLGADHLVDSVACRPGHPQILARLDSGAYVAGLPGNPFAALAAAYTTLVPLLHGLTGRPLPALPHAVLSTPVPALPGRTRIVPVTWNGPTAHPLGNPRPAFLNGAATGNALAVIPPNAAPEAPVPLLLLD